MTTVLQYLVIAGVIGLVVFGLAMLVFGRGEQLAPLSPRVSPTELPETGITGSDVEQVRFATALRGYRMSDVDWALRRLGTEIDRLRAELDGRDAASPDPADDEEPVFAGSLGPADPASTESIGSPVGPARPPGTTPTDPADPAMSTS